MTIPLLIDPSRTPCFSLSVPSSTSRHAAKSTNLLLRDLHGTSSPLISKSNRGFPLLYLSPISVNSRCSYVSSASAHQASSNNSEETISKHPTDVKTLIRAYREALSDGNETAVAEIETIFCKIEKEKNKMDRRVLSLSMEIASEKDSKIRLQADFDNTRKRLEKERLSTESNAKVHIMKSLLPIIDSFEKAKQLTKPETEKEKKIDTSYQGIYRQFVEGLRHLRVAAIATVGKPFDPLLHEAISREESVTVKAGIITEELSRGFLLGDSVLRRAKVKVSSGASEIKTPSDTH